MARIGHDPGTNVAGNVFAAARNSTLALFGALLALAWLGLIGGWAYLHSEPTHSAPASPPQHLETRVEVPEKKIDFGLPPEEPLTLERGDEWFREGLHDLALTVYETLAPSASGTLKDALQYRIGLSLEGLGRTADAITAYRAVVSKGENPRAVTAAQVGLARLSLRLHRPTEAKNLLYSVLLRSALPELKEARFSGDIRYLLALALGLEATRSETRPDALNDALTDDTATDWPVELALDWVQSETSDAPAKPRKASDFVIVSQPDTKPGRGVERASVSATVAPGLLSELLVRIAERARLKLEQTEAARKAIAGRHVQAAFENLPLADVLLALTDPLSLVWSIKDGTLRLTTEVELTAQEAAAFRRFIARQTLESARLHQPAHFLTAASSLVLGNLDARAGNGKDAADHYERLRIESPRSPVNVDGQYNLGIVRSQMGQLPEARKAFLAVVENNPGHALAPLVYLRIGQTYLLEGDANGAIASLEKARDAATGTAAQGPAALMLACARIIAKLPRAATGLLQGKDREAVMRDDLRATAFFLDAYAEYLSRAAEKNTSETLLSALLNLPGETPLGNPGTLLIGQAYRDLGMTARMVAVYEKAQPRLKGAIASEIAFALADTLRERNRHDEAGQCFLALTKADHGPWSAQAQLRLAAMALQDRRADECLSWCKKLLESKTPAVEKNAILALVGRAYESKGDSARAAMAFSGKVPE
jgi:tetratricopeptide (TPR) repeat protein